MHSGRSRSAALRCWLPETDLPVRSSRSCIRASRRRCRDGADQDPRHQDDPHRAEPHPPGGRQGRDDRAGARRLGLRHVHAARAGRPDGARAVPQAVPHRPQRRRDRGHLAVELRQLVLAQRPVLFNAMSGVDIALWDIKGKRAGMPLYQLLGGKVRHGADCYFHASGTSFAEVEDSARRAMEQGFRHVRVQVATPGYAGYGARSTAPAPAGGAERGRRPDQSERDLGAGALRAHAAEAVRAPAHQARRRGRAAARRARARHASTRRSTCARRSSRTACSSSRIRSRRKRTITSGCCASRRACRSRWASCSTRSTNTCRSSRSG